MKLTLLDMVQDILNDLDSDEVNSLDDTVEATQIAQILKTTYQALAANRNWAHQKSLIQLAASGNTAIPTHMTLDSQVKELSFIKYNKIKSGETRKRYEDIHYLYPDEFLEKLNVRDNDKSNVLVVTDTVSSVDLLIETDKHPTYWTSFDDETIVFDSYDSAIESTLQASKVQAFGVLNLRWTATDLFIPDMPEEAFPGFLAEAKSTAFLVLKQMTNEKAEQSATRQRRWLSRKNWSAKGGIKYQNYGRRKTRSPGQPLDKTTVVNNP